MSDATAPDIEQAIQSLASAVRAAGDTEPAGRVLYHCDRLGSALRSSHAEAIRFAAFTINRIITAHPESFGDAVVERLSALRTALASRGHGF